MNISDYKHDKEKAEDGTWLDFDGSQFLIASSKGSRFQRFIAAEARKHNQAEMKRNPGIFIDITNRALATIVLKDWRNVKSGTKDFPCTPENKTALVAMPEFRDWLAEASADLDNFRAEAVAEDAATLKSGS